MAKRDFGIIGIVGIGLAGSIIYDKWVKPYLASKNVIPYSGTTSNYVGHL